MGSQMRFWVERGRRRRETLERIKQLDDGG